MQEPALTTTLSPERIGLEEAAARAQQWFGEPFLHPGEDADVALAPGAARRLALDDAIEEIDACLILGAGYPFFRGGITKHLDQTGVSQRVVGRPLAELGNTATGSTSL